VVILVIAWIARGAQRSRNRGCPGSLPAGAAGVKTLQLLRRSARVTAYFSSVVLDLHLDEEKERRGRVDAKAQGRRKAAKRREEKRREGRGRGMAPRP
jgi:hypothetical protein